MGYNLKNRIMDKAQPFTVEEIRRGLETSLIGKEIHIFSELGSTNDLAKDMAAQGAPAGTVILADSQTKGRGRMGRSFVSPPGVGIYLSIILRPSLPPIRLSLLTLASGVAVARAITAVTGLKASLKWPNDLLINNKKAVGILTEGKIEDNRMSFLIIGIGINVNNDSTHFPSDLLQLVTSLKIEMGEPISRTALVTKLLQQMERSYLQLEAGDEEGIIREWSNYSDTLGKWIRVSSQNRVTEGLAERVDETGALVLRRSDGQRERVTAGDVTLLKDS